MRTARVGVAGYLLILLGGLSAGVPLAQALGPPPDTATLEPIDGGEERCVQLFEDTVIVTDCNAEGYFDDEVFRR